MLCRLHTCCYYWLSFGAVDHLLSIDEMGESQMLCF